jgi:hypothetical protein
MSESRSEKDCCNALSIVQLLTKRETLSIVEQIAIVSQGNARIVIRVNYRRDEKLV